MSGNGPVLVRIFRNGRLSVIVALCAALVLLAFLYLFGLPERLLLFVAIVAIPAIVTGVFRKGGELYARRAGYRPGHYHEEHIPLLMPEPELRELAEDAALSFLREHPRCRVAYRGERLTAIEIPGGWRSWGEELRLQLQAGQGMQISSRCTSQYQYFDWGKNHGNVQSLRGHLKVLSQRRSG